MNDAHTTWISRRPHLIPSVLAAIMLLGALGYWPYGYYVLLRWVICPAAIFVLAATIIWKTYWACWAFGVVVMLFNPIAPIHLTREIWRIVDLVVAALFLIGIVVLSAPSKNQTQEP